MAFIYACGPYEIQHASPNSAFSKGDVLEFVAGASESSLSGFHPGAASTAAIAGVALADSGNSYNDLVPYLVANDDTVYIVDVATGIDFREGEEMDITTVSGDYQVADSTNTARAVCVYGTDQFNWNFNNSDVSKVLVRLLSGDGEIEYV